MYNTLKSLNLPHTTFYHSTILPCTKMYKSRVNVLNIVHTESTKRIKKKNNR